MNIIPLNGDTPHPEDDSQPAPEIYILGPEHEHALIGHAVDPNHPPRFCYSLTKMADEHKKRRGCRMDVAREWLWKNVILKVIEEQGDNAPLFIDDMASAEKPLIILPGR